MSSSSDLQKIFKKLSIKLKPDLFKMALTHSSATFENPTAYKNPEIENYERLEFLGDSILKLAISDILYTTYPDYNEGRMTKIRGILISDLMLAKIGRTININDLIIVGKNEKKDHGKDKESIIACVMEAIIGAIYLSHNFDVAMKYIKYLYKDYIEDVDKNLSTYNAKAVLQEYTQSLNKDLPTYKLVKEKGEAHKKTFYYEVIYNNDILATGKGKTKRDAQQEAAKNACLKLGIIKGDLNE